MSETEPPDFQRRFASVERIGEGVYPFGPDFVRIDLRCASNSFTELLPLNVAAAFDSFEAEIPSSSGVKKLTVSVRFCHLTIRESNCEVVLDSLSSQTLQEGAFEATSETDKSAEINVGLDAGSFPKFLARLGFKRKIRSKSRQYTQLVAPVGSGWRIGIKDLGDPLRADNNFCLLSLYLVKGRDPRNGNFLLKLSAAQSEISLTINARDGLFVTRHTIGKASPADDAQREATIEWMKSRIAGMVLEKILPEPVVLAHERYTIRTDTSLCETMSQSKKNSSRLPAAANTARKRKKS